MDLFVVDIGTPVFVERPTTIGDYSLVYVSSYDELGEKIHAAPKAVVLSDVRNDLMAIKRCLPDENRLIAFDAKWSAYRVLRGLHQRVSGFLESNDDKALYLALKPILAGQIVICDKAARAIRCLVNTSI